LPSRAHVIVAVDLDKRDLPELTLFNEALFLPRPGEACYGALQTKPGQRDCCGGAAASMALPSRTSRLIGFLNPDVHARLCGFNHDQGMPVVRAVQSAPSPDLSPQASFDSPSRLRGPLLGNAAGRRTCRRRSRAICESTSHKETISTGDTCTSRNRSDFPYHPQPIKTNSPTFVAIILLPRGAYGRPPANPRAVVYTNSRRFIGIPAKAKSVS